MNFDGVFKKLKEKSSKVANEKSYSLALAMPGERLRIEGYRSGKGMRRRLSDLGLTLGTEVEILHRQGGGGVIVARDGMRVALGAEAARLIQVSLLGRKENSQHV
jgi:Fe2+ transport system protein FeoA